MSRIFTTAKEAYEELRRSLKEMQSVEYQSETYQDKDVKNKDEFMTKEMWSIDFKITDIDSRKELVDEYDLSEEYIIQEFKDRISPECLNPGNSWECRKDVWEKFLEEDGRFSYTYNGRIRASLKRVVQELKDKKNTRQAIIPIFWPKDVHNAGGKSRIPCSMYYQFLIRKDKLHIIYNMRSCDLGTHLLYDIYLAMDIQTFVADLVDVDTGTFNMHIGSLHSFKRDLEGVF